MKATRRIPHQSLIATLAVLAAVAAVGIRVVVLASREEQLSGPAEGVAHDAAGRPTLDTLWPVPAFSFVDQHGQPVTRDSFAGRPWIANFIFTQCRSVCPLLTAKMVQLQRKLPAGALRFVSFSVDPAHDTPEVLADYARTWNATETRWSLLSTDAAGLRAAMAGLHVTAEPQADPDSPILHSAVFLLVDAQGVVRGAYDTEDPTALKGLLRDAQTLLGAATAEAGLPADGLGLYHALSCAGCHERPELAPTLRGLAGKRREMNTGELQVADAAYVRESIVAPQFKRVRGYPLLMPSYEGLATPVVLDTLVAWVLALPAAEAVPVDAIVETDPVCQMQVRVVADTPFSEHAGHRYHFCSQGCRDRFAQNPAAWVR